MAKKKGGTGGGGGGGGGEEEEEEGKMKLERDFGWCGKLIKKRDEGKRGDFKWWCVTERQDLVRD